MAGGQPSGIAVVMNDKSEGTELFDAILKSTDRGVASGKSPFMPVPDGTVRVVVAVKPDARLPSAKPQK
jgi:hypothetical protein